MTAVSDFASIAAAATGGYKEVVVDYGANASPRFLVTLEKPATGTPGAMTRAYGQGASQVAAESVALAALNAQRRHHYGGAPGRASGDGDSQDSRGNTHSIDAT